MEDNQATKDAEESYDDLVPFESDEVAESNDIQPDFLEQEAAVETGENAFVETEDEDETSHAETELAPLEVKVKSAKGDEAHSEKREEATDEFSETNFNNGEAIEIDLHDVSIKRLGSRLCPSSYEMCMKFKIGDPNILESLTQKVIRKVTCGEEFDPMNKENQQVVWLRNVLDIVHNLEETGVLYSLYKDEEHIYILLGLSDVQLTDWAIKEKFQLRLNPEKAKAYGEKIHFPLARSELPLKLFNDIWVGVHDKGIERDLYEKHGTNADPHSETTIFSTKDRLALVYRVLCSNRKNGGCHFKIDRWCGDPDHPLQQVFPLTNQHERKLLKDNWTLCECLVEQQEGHQKDLLVTRIRNYYGESVGFYWAFLLHFLYGLFTLFPIAATLMVFYFLNDQSLDCQGAVPVIIIYCAWPMLFGTFWKRTEGELRSIWGCKASASLAALKRPEFHGKQVLNPITGRLDEVYDNMSRMMRLAISFLINFIYVMIVLLIIAGLMGFRSWWVNEHPDDAIMPSMIGFATSIQVIIFDYIYKIIIFYLTQFENHRTQSEYENSFVRKTFVMKFLNGFMSLYYLGFVQPFFWPDSFKDKNGDALKGEAFNQRVLEDLALQTAMLFVSLLFVNNATELLVPKFMKWWSGDNKDESAVRKEANKDQCTDTMDDMSEIVMVYAYITLFLVANPLLPVLGIVFALVEFVVDRSKYQYLCQRMIPQSCTGIGTWNNCLRFIAQFGIFTNLALLTWRTNQVSNTFGEGYELSFFIIMTLAVTAIMLVFENVISDVSVETRKRILRQDEIERRLIFDEKTMEFEKLDGHINKIQFDEIPDILTFEHMGQESSV